MLYYIINHFINLIKIGAPDRPTDRLTDHVHEEVCGRVDDHEEVGEGDDGLEDRDGLAVLEHAAEETLVDVCKGYLKKCVKIE